MNKKTLASVASLAAGVSMLVTSGGVASAAAVPVFPNYGFDGNANLIVGYLPSNPGGSTGSPTPSAGKCDRTLSTGLFPLDNDIKPVLSDVEHEQGGLSTAPLSTNNPANWIWFGSNGLLSAYPYLSQPFLFDTQFNTFPLALNGTPPFPGTIGGDAYPAEEILSMVTADADATCPIVGGVCNLTAGPASQNGVVDANGF